jgi:4-amino-4-deoxy-L-arabinose transferase-like glycosyltransferase
MTTDTSLRQRTNSLCSSMFISSRSKQHWLTLLTWIVVLIFFVVATWMRLHLLNVPFDRDSYDEGVYWQSLRSMSTGSLLYQQIFYSQPPAFLLSIYPFYALLGQTIWSARLGIAIISLFGFVGALLLGKALAGRLGMLFALLLLIINPLYLTESQTLQADGPSTALTLLAVGLAYLWWEKPDGLAGYCLATLTGITLALSILIKLLAVPTVIPISLLALAHLVRVKKQAGVIPSASTNALFFGSVAFVLTTILLLEPFRYTFPQLWQMVVTFHTTPKGPYLATLRMNGNTMSSILVSFLGASALYGTLIALLRRDWRVIPLLAWLIITIYLLWQQVPIFSHYLVALTPPLIALAVMGISPITSAEKRPRQLDSPPFPWLPRKMVFLSKKLAFPAFPAFPAFLKGTSTTTHPLAYITTALAMILAIFQVVVNIQSIESSYNNAYAMAHSPYVQRSMQIMQDLQRVTKQDQLVITDAQFIAAQANRSTPASLVDTSLVRIFTGYVTTEQLIEDASQPQVHAILFYTNRLDIFLPAFDNWVQHHFHLAYTYGKGEELWVKNP